MGLNIGSANLSGVHRFSVGPHLHGCRIPSMGLYRLGLLPFGSADIPDFGSDSIPFFTVANVLLCPAMNGAGSANLGLLAVAFPPRGCLRP